MGILQKNIDFLQDLLIFQGFPIASETRNN